MDAIEVTQAHPAGRGDPAPLTPPSILPLLDSLGWAGIRFFRTQLKHTKTSQVSLLKGNVTSTFWNLCKIL